MGPVEIKEEENALMIVYSYNNLLSITKADGEKFALLPSYSNIEVISNWPEAVNAWRKELKKMDYTVGSVDATKLAPQYGSVHCATNQVPMEVRDLMLKSTSVLLEDNVENEDDDDVLTHTLSGGGKGSKSGKGSDGDEGDKAKYTLGKGRKGGSKGGKGSKGKGGEQEWQARLARAKQARAARKGGKGG